ncbi:MAG: 16S rRNA (uracil(1498)-N(3))-methyltransferase [Gammaproteobacteria bacterium]
MRLSRIYVAQPLRDGARITLGQDSSHYLRNVLRLKPGVLVALFNGDDCYDYESLLSYQGKQAIAEIQQRTAGTTEAALSTEIIQGLSRSDHMDWMIQKTTELGVKGISVFNAEHSQIPLKQKQRDKRLAHWQAVAIKACEQSGRYRPPQIVFHQSLAEVLEDSIVRDARILLDFEGRRLQDIPVNADAAQHISILPGPEGGLSKAEIKLARASGFIPTRLGPRVLRTETAAVTALAIVQSTWGDI